MQTLLALLLPLMVPLAILNMLGSIVSGIWLAILGEWKAIGIGLVLLFVSHIGLSFALMPSLLLAVPGAHFAEKGNRVGMIIFSFLNIAYVMALITVWCVSILYYFTVSLMTNSHSLLPLLIWSYGIATSPWVFFAQKDHKGGGNEFSLFSTVIAELAYVVAILMILFGDPTVRDVLQTFALIMAVGLTVQTVAAISASRTTHGYG